MATVVPHFTNILYRNFDPYREPLCIRFVSQGDRTIPARVLVGGLSVLKFMILISLIATD
jgi:hypothetical protein